MIYYVVLLLTKPALTLKEGRVLKMVSIPDLDELRSLATNSEQWLAKMEADIKEATGLSKIKTGYNKVFGYYFEVSHSKSEQVPDYFIRKQTLANAERYITPELKEFEIKILSAKDKIIALEHELYQQLRNDIKLVIKMYKKQLEPLLSLM